MKRKRRDRKKGPKEEKKGTAGPSVTVWFGLALASAALFAVLALREAFAGKYVVQDDARQFVFWMQRFVDPEAFPHDLIADYFQSITPPGYTMLYRMMAGVGMHPLLLNKLLPMVLGLVTAGYCFGISMRILPVPAAGFAATLLLNQNLWMKDDLVSATPRAFIYPLFLAFVYHLVQGSTVGWVTALALQGLFYPQTVLVSVGVLVLRLVRCETGRPHLVRSRREYLSCATGLAVVLLVLVPYAWKASEFGPLITPHEARALPEFSPAGRARFFVADFWRFWLCGERSGILPREWCVSPLKPPQILAGLLLPILLGMPGRFPLGGQVTEAVAILPRIALASLGMFFLAHAVLFKMHLPSRYTQHTLRMVMAVAAGITLLLAWDALRRWSAPRGRDRRRGRRMAVLGSAALVGAFLILYPAFLRLRGYPFPLTGYVVGRAPPVYEFFSRQPKDILIASLAEEVNNLPTFSGRSILVGGEYAIPYQVGYYRRFRQRVLDLIRAQYGASLADAQRLIQTYGVDYWLLDLAEFTPEYVASTPWIRQFEPLGTEYLGRLSERIIPALGKVMERCTVFESGPFVVLDAKCILKAPSE